MVEPGANGHDEARPREDGHDEAGPREEGHDEAHERERLPRRERLRRWRRRHPWAAIAIVLGVVLLLVAAALVLHHLWKYENTDDAEVDAHVATIAPRVTGTVQRVLVEDNTPVKAGQLLVELDPRDFDVAAAQAEAQLMQAQAELDAAQADVTSARANAAKSRADLERAKYLVRERAIPQEQLDTLQAAARVADATLASAEARARATGHNVQQQSGGQRVSVGARAAAVKAAQTALEKAKLELSYTRIEAPFDGVVGRRNVEPGYYVAAGQELMALVDVSHPWVTANFKETQLRQMQPGQTVRIHVDALARNFSGHIESFPAATGARFSLLPPENATGNYVKVVQRLPVRIRFDGDQQLEALRPGMSVEPRVTVHP